MEKLSSMSISLHEKSHKKRLATGRQNPVGVSGVLNRHYAWNMPGVREDKSKQRVLTAAELPKLGLELYENNKQLTVTDA